MARQPFGFIVRLLIFVRLLIEERRSEGAISVRSTGGSSETLWFHLSDIELMLPGAYPLSLNPPSSSCKGLTRIGTNIISRVLAIPGVVSVDVRPDYFSVEVASMFEWQFLLPKIVAVIREFHPRCDAPVRLRRHCDPRSADWQQDLLASKFPEAAVRPVNKGFKERVCKVVLSSSSTKPISGNELIHVLGWPDIALHSADLYKALQQLVAEKRIVSVWQPDGTTGKVELQYQRQSVKSDA